MDCAACGAGGSRALQRRLPHVPAPAPWKTRGSPSQHHQAHLQTEAHKCRGIGNLPATSSTSASAAGNVRAARPPGGPVHVDEARSQDNVPDQHIIVAYEISRDERRLSVSLETVELTSTSPGTRLVYTEQGAFLDVSHAPARKAWAHCSTRLAPCYETRQKRRDVAGKARDRNAGAVDETQGRRQGRARWCWTCRYYWMEPARGRTRTRRPSCPPRAGALRGLERDCSTISGRRTSHWNRQRWWHPRLRRTCASGS